MIIDVILADFELNKDLYYNTIVCSICLICYMQSSTVLLHIIQYCVKMMKVLILFIVVDRKIVLILQTILSAYWRILIKNSIYRVILKILLCLHQAFHNCYC